MGRSSCGIELAEIRQRGEVSTWEYDKKKGSVAWVRVFFRECRDDGTKSRPYELAREATISEDVVHRFWKTGAKDAMEQIRAKEIKLATAKLAAGLHALKAKARAMGFELEVVSREAAAGGGDVAAGDGGGAGD